MKKTVFIVLTAILAVGLNSCKEKNLDLVGTSWESPNVSIENGNVSLTINFKSKQDATIKMNVQASNPFGGGSLEIPTTIEATYSYVHPKITISPKEAINIPSPTKLDRVELTIKDNDTMTSEVMIGTATITITFKRKK